MITIDEAQMLAAQEMGYTDPKDFLEKTYPIESIFEEAVLNFSRRSVEIYAEKMRDDYPKKIIVLSAGRSKMKSALLAYLRDEGLERWMVQVDDSVALGRPIPNIAQYVDECRDVILGPQFLVEREIPIDKTSQEPRGVIPDKFSTRHHIFKK